MIDDLSARALAAKQHGVVSSRQLACMGISASTRHALIDGRRWQRLTPRVIALVGSTPTRAQRAMLAVLDAGLGAALCGRSAAAWWGVPGTALEPFEVVRRRGHAGGPSTPRGRHDPCLLPDHHVRMLDGVPTVTPARALFDIAGTRRRGAELPWWVERMARLTDTAWSMRLVSGVTLHAMLEDLAQRGRPGIRTMRQVLADRPVGYTPPASALESRFEQILARAGQEPFRRQVDLGDKDWIGRVDFRDQRRPLVVEVQSERFHTSLVDVRADRDRIGQLSAAGVSVIEITEEDIWVRPERVVRRVTEARHRLDQAALPGPSRRSHPANLSTNIAILADVSRRVASSGTTLANQSTRCATGRTLSRRVRERDVRRGGRPLDRRCRP